MNRVLVTGANGLIGRALAAELIEAGVPVNLQVRSRAAMNESVDGKVRQRLHDDGAVQIVEADFLSASNEDLKRMVAHCSAVVHAAGLVHKPDSQWRDYEVLNVRTTQNLAESAAAAGVSTFVFLSTSAVYGPGPFFLQPEEAPLNPVTPYALSKQKSEEWLRTFDKINTTIVFRLSLVFGEGDRGNLIKLIRQIERRRYFNVGMKPAQKSIIYAKDLARLVRLCMGKVDDAYTIFNVANPVAPSLDELSAAIAGALGLFESIPTMPLGVVRLGARIAETVLGQRSPVTVEQINKLATTTTIDCKKVVEATGFSPEYSLTQAIEKEVTWARKEGILRLGRT